VHEFYYPIQNNPVQVVIDPDYAVLMQWDIDKPEPAWIRQLRNGSSTIQKIKAAKALGKKATPKSVEALGTALLEETFWGTQVEIAKTLGSLKSEPALDWLLKAVEIKNTKARTAVATALGQFYKSDRAFHALKKLLQDTESHFVVAAAATSIGKIQHDSSFEELTEFLENCPQSWHDIITIGCLEGIVATEKEEAIGIIKKYLELGTSDWVRRMAPNMLARLGKRYKEKYPEMGSIIEKHILDRSYRVQQMSIAAATTYEDASLIPALSSLAEQAADSGIVRRCRVAIRELSKKKEPTEIDSLKKSIEELQQENRNLKGRLDKIESRLDKREE
jgi:aminopeptidase N